MICAHNLSKKEKLLNEKKKKKKKVKEEEERTRGVRPHGEVRDPAPGRTRHPERPVCSIGFAH
jgi:hypothetical protein